MSGKIWKETERIDIMGLPVTPFSLLEDAVTFAGQRISHGLQTVCVAINPSKSVLAREEPQLESILQNAEMGIIDGIGIVLAGVILYGRHLPRCTGVDLFGAMVEAATAEQWRVFLLGATPESNAGAKKALEEVYPTLQIAGARDGYFESGDDVVAEINASGAEILFVAMGSPRQELWIGENRQQLSSLFIQGVGGTFDTLSGVAPRAPALVRRMGIEFLYRLVQKPEQWRRVRRYPGFIWRVIVHRLSGHSANQ
jgi:N-acetylglucosaminyldiphosphoundecaprenol N-acetyl-beta-D-mannosaminyltransferase